MNDMNDIRANFHENQTSTFWEITFTKFEIMDNQQTSTITIPPHRGYEWKLKLNFKNQQRKKWKQWMYVLCCPHRRAVNHSPSLTTVEILTSKKVRQEHGPGKCLVDNHLFCNCCNISQWQKPVEVLVPYMWHGTKEQSNCKHSTWPITVHKYITSWYVSNVTEIRCCMQKTVKCL